MRVFLHNGDPHTVHMRGLPVFEGWAALGIPVDHGHGLGLKYHHPVHPGDFANLRMLISLPINPNVLETIQIVRAAGAVVVVDVCFPFHIPDMIVSTTPDDPAAAWGAMDAWTDPDNRRVAEACMAEADWVSVSQPAWVDGMERYNPRVVHLPDCTDPPAVSAFSRSLEALWDTPRDGDSPT